MFKRTDYYMALAACCMLTLWACNKDVESLVPDNPEKSLIQLAAGVTEEEPVTKQTLTRTTVTTESTGARPFDAGTSVYLVLKSENAKDSQADAMYTRTIGYAQGESSKNNDVKFAAAYGRFWEDSYSRNSQLSAYAACVPGYYLNASVYQDAVKSGSEDRTIWKINGSDNYDNTWGNDKGNTTLMWPLRDASVANQNTGDFVASQDLCFSNNVADTPGTGRVVFDETAKVFGSGLMVFYHALSRISFKIKKGEGFEPDEKFEFSEAGKNIVLSEFLSQGTFDIEEGEFISGEAATINQLSIAATGTDGFDYILDGLVLPGTDLTDEAVGTVSFTINNNLYQLSKKTLYNALSKKATEDSKTLRLNEGKLLAGVHYVFTMTVGKKKMDSFTASVVPWESVTAAETAPSNARIKVSLLDNGEPQAGENASFDLYRAANESAVISDDFESDKWNTGYEGPATLIESESGIYAANNWYWPNNKTFYHFRAIMPTGHTVTEDKVNGDYMTLTGADDYTDVCWGAPFTQDGDISKAIGPTKNTINLVLTHMMSEVTINLTTTTGNDQVNVTGALMEMSSIYPTARVRMGSGEVVYSDDAVTVANGNAVPWTHGFVPQSLENTVLTITTADDNQYRVSMKDVLADGNNKPISEWKPGHKYTYTFKLAKTGITQMSATLKDWVEVTGGNDNVQIQ